MAQETIDPSYRNVLIEHGQEYLKLAKAEFSAALRAGDPAPRCM